MCIRPRSRVQTQGAGRAFNASSFDELDFIKTWIIKTTGRPEAHVFTGALASPPRWHAARANGRFGPGLRVRVHGNLPRRRLNLNHDGHAADPLGTRDSDAARLQARAAGAAAGPGIKPPPRRPAVLRLSDSDSGPGAWIQTPSTPSQTHGSEARPGPTSASFSGNIRQY